MALKSRKIYPQYMVYAWVVDDSQENGASLTLLDEFNDEEEAIAFYDSIEVEGDILQVDLDCDTELTCETIRQKDQLHEWIN